MANPKKPANVHMLKGTYRKDRHGPMPETESKAPDKPEWLSGSGEIEWDRLVPLLQSRGYLAETDGISLGLLCELSAEMAASPIDFPASKLGHLRLLFGEFGLTPSGRSKLPQTPAQKPNNPFEGM